MTNGGKTAKRLNQLLIIRDHRSGQDHVAAALRDADWRGRAVRQFQVPLGKRDLPTWPRLSETRIGGACAVWQFQVPLGKRDLPVAAALRDADWRGRAVWQFQVPLGKRDLPTWPRLSGRGWRGLRRAGPARQAGPTHVAAALRTRIPLGQRYWQFQVPLGKRDLPTWPRLSETRIGSSRSRSASGTYLRIGRGRAVRHRASHTQSTRAARTI